MRSKNTVKQMLDFHRATFENFFSLTAVLQCQAENIFNFFRYSPGMSGEIRAFMDKRIGSYRKEIDDLKKVMNEECAKAEKFFDNNTGVLFQDQTEKIFNSFLNRSKGMPHHLKKSLENLSAVYKTGCDEFKKYVEKNC